MYVYVCMGMYVCMYVRTYVFFCISLLHAPLLGVILHAYVECTEVINNIDTIIVIMYVCMYVCMCVCVCMYVCITYYGVFICMYECVCEYVYMYLCRQVFMYFSSYI